MYHHTSIINCLCFFFCVNRICLFFCFSPFNRITKKKKIILFGWYRCMYVYKYLLLIFFFFIYNYISARNSCIAKLTSWRSRNYFWFCSFKQNENATKYFSKFFFSIIHKWCVYTHVRVYCSLHTYGCMCVHQQKKKI